MDGPFSMKISNTTNQIKHSYLLDIENQLRRQQSITQSEFAKAEKLYPERCGTSYKIASADLSDANKSRVLFDQVKKFLMDRSMIEYGAANRAARGGWEPSPCLLDDDGKQVTVTDEATVVRDKWSR